MKKHLLSLLCVLALCSAQAQNYSFVNNGIYYRIVTSTTPNTVVVTRNPTDYKSSISIPASVTNAGITYPVTSVADSAFYNCNYLTAISIPSSVTSIGNFAFNGCTKLTSVTIPNSVTILGNSAFNYTSITSITIPSSVTSIGNDAFNHCSSMTSVTFTSPSSVTSISSSTFMDCVSLTSISIPSSVTSIGGYAFYNCTGLTSITIPNSVTSIGGSAFNSCSNLTSITFPNSITDIYGGAFTGTPWYKNQPDGPIIINNIFYTYKGTCPTNYTIPNTVTSIAANAFQYFSLNSITIPNSVKKIGNWAFSNCTSLTSVSFPSSVTYIGDGAFAYCTNLASISIPNSVTYIGGNAFISTAWYFTQPDGFMITNNVLWAYKGVVPVNIVIPNGVTTITTFLSQNPIYTITIPNSVTSISTELADVYLTSVYLMSTTPISDVVNNVFPFNSDDTLFVPQGTKSTYQNAFPWNKFATIIEVGFTVSSNSVPIASPVGSTATINVTSQSNWKATSLYSWLTVSPSITTSGNATLTFTAEENTNTATRTAYVTISSLHVSDQTITVIQAPKNTLSVPTNTVSISYATNSTATVTVTSNTTWTATSNETWLTVNPAVATTGNATLTFTATANPNASTRDATVTIIAGGITQTITVTQAAILPQTTLSLTSASVSATPNTFTQITITSNVEWTASSDQTWLVVTQSSTTGNGTVTLAAEPNTTNTARTATVTITTSGGSQTITVTQAAGTGTGIEIETNKNIKVYPNPTTENVIIELIGNAIPSSFEIINLKDQKVYSGIVTGKTTVSMQHFPAGIYTVLINNGTQTTSQQIIKQ